MWMETCDTTDLVEDKNFSMGTSKCALAFREKFRLLQTIFDIMEEPGVMDDFCDDEFLHLLEEASDKSTGCGCGKDHTIAKHSLAQSKPKTKKRAGK